MWSFLQRAEALRRGVHFRVSVNLRGSRRSKERTALREDQNLEGKPQERDRDGISPADCSGSKASRGCETLRTQRNQWFGNHWRYVAPGSWENAEGEKTLEGA
jgi:hypothetical protein